jgi:uncharacterized protein YjaG (DUF416 family)
MFEEEDKEMLRRLDALPVSFRVAFAASCAERIVPAYRPYAEYMDFEDPDLLNSIMDSAWEGIAMGAFDQAQFADRYDNCLALLTDEDEGDGHDCESMPKRH